MRDNKSTLREGRATPRLIIALVLLGITTAAWASGWPPFPRQDSATVVRGGTVQTLDSGNQSVLDNDFDFEGDKLTAFLDDDVKHGTLVLRPDGTFSYTHDGKKKDSDSFTYRAFDGTSYAWSSTRVEITIEDVPNSPPYVVSDVEDQEAVAGFSYRLELAGNFADRDEGDTLDFSARGLPRSNSLRLDSFTGVLSGIPVDRDIRDDPYEVEITATDRAGASVSLVFDLTIIADRRADVALSMDLASNPVGIGETTQWNIQVVNNGPSDLDEAELTTAWVTAGPSLELSSPSICSISSNNTATPTMSCAISALAAGETLTIPVDGNQSADGDNSLIGIVVADDPVPNNNYDLVSSQVVAEFSEGPTQVINLSGMGVDAGDVNGDGEIDIVAADAQTLVFLNNGNRAVTTPGVSLGADSGGSAVALMDWNADGFLDVAVGGLAARAAEIFVNDGSGGFASAERLQGGIGNVNDMIAADLNNDGRSDLVLVGSTGSLVMRSLSQGGFAQTTLSSGAGLAVEIADLDLDGDQDIIVIRLADRRVDVHLNSGNGSSFTRIRRNYGSVATVRSIDANSDGSPDLLLGVDGDDLSAPQNKVYLGQSDGTYTAGGTFGASPSTALLAGDVDDDGWPDVIAVNEAGVHQVYLGSGSGNFALAPEQIVSAGMRRGVLVDFNSDDSLDLIMLGRDSSVLELHANNGIGRLGPGDRNAPVVRLNGQATISIAAGAAFIDEGATATDDIDGDLTDQIKVSGQINTAVVGTQTLSYSATDRAGNTSTVVRTINIGVNSGTGGSGGGVLAPAFILMLFLLAVLRARPND